MFKYITSLFLFLAASFIGRAETLTVAPGQLSELIKNAATVTELTLAGEINAADLQYIDTELTALNTLDLSDAHIVASQGKRIGIATNFNDKTIPENTFAGARFTSVILPSEAGLKIGAGAFAGSRLTSIVIPATVAAVTEGAFTGCTALKSASIGASELGAAAFSGCTALQSVAISGATTLPERVFMGCTALTKINGADRMTAIGARAFSGCKSLKNIAFGKALMSIGEAAFEGSGLLSADLSETRSLESVGAWAFANMDALETLDLGGISSMGEGVAFKCPSLTELTVRNIARIPAYAYAKDDALDSIGILPESVTEIGAYALSDMTSISEFTIPAGVEYIGEHAMQRMTSLSQIRVLASDVPALGDDVWAGVDQPNVRVFVPDQAVSLYQATPQWQDFQVNGFSSVSDVIADGDRIAGLRARFVGNELQVSIDGVEIETLAIYTVGGTLLVYLEPSDGFASIDTSDFSDNLYIVSATLADGRGASAKVMRQ